MRGEVNKPRINSVDPSRSPRPILPCQLLILQEKELRGKGLRSRSKKILVKKTTDTAFFSSSSDKKSGDRPIASKIWLREEAKVEKQMEMILPP